MSQNFRDMKKPAKSSPYPPELDDFVEALARLLLADYDRRMAAQAEGNPNERKDFRNGTPPAAAEQQTSESVSTGIKKGSGL